MSLDAYNQMTPYELHLYVQDYNERTEREQKERLISVYLGAYLYRVKDFPSFDKFLNADKPKKEQTPEDMLEEIKKMNAALGGTTY